MSITAVSPERQSGSRRSETARLFIESGREADPRRRQELLAAVVVVNRPVAITMAGRYRGRGVADEDLQQIACEGLINAVARFDPDLGYHFLSFAVPTIRGELRRSFRDQGWMVRPPRRIQELQARLHRVSEELDQRLQRHATEAELEDAMGISRAELIEAQRAYGSFRPSSLDQPILTDRQRSLGELLADPAADETAKVEARIVLEPLLNALPEEDRRILFWRFWEELTQRQIGDRLGLTQVQISRRLQRILAQLGTTIGEAA